MVIAAPLPAQKTAGGASGPRPGTTEKIAAKRIWEDMIEAKAGRERLYEIETMVREEYDRLVFPNPRFKNGDQHSVAAMAFPDREWDWVDSRPTVFGASVSITDVSAGFWYRARAGEDVKNMGDTKPGQNILQKNQLLFLSETRWFKPEPIRVLTGKDIPRDVEAIETNISGNRVDFWVDRDKRLPVRIVEYQVFPWLSKEPMASEEYRLSKYQKLDGIQIPYKISSKILASRSGPSTSDRYTIRLNVKLREDLFSKPPRFEDGPDAWKAP
jgi:hypothetical protein